MGGLPHSWSKTKGREFGDPLLLAVRPAVRLATEHDRRARVEVAPVVSERRRRSPGERPSVVVEQLGRVAEIVYNDLRLRLVGIDVEQVPDADREVHLAKPVPQFGVDERLRPVPLSAQTAVTWLRRGELAVVGRARERMEPAHGILTGQRSPPVGPLLRDPDPSHGIDQAALAGALQYR